MSLLESSVYCLQDNIYYIILGRKKNDMRHWSACCSSQCTTNTDYKFHLIAKQTCLSTFNLDSGEYFFFCPAAQCSPVSLRPACVVRLWMQANKFCIFFYFYIFLKILTSPTYSSHHIFGCSQCLFLAPPLWHVKWHV